MNQSGIKRKAILAATILAGKPIADQIALEVRKHAERFFADQGRKPTLAAVLVGEDPASAVYVRNKENACHRAGLESRLIRLDRTASQNELLDLIESLNQDPNVNGILVQLPLPEHLDSQAILDAVSPHKDVDGFHPINTGLLSQGRPRFIPCTPLGILEILRAHKIDTAGKMAVVVGRSDIVGKPMALLLMQRDPVVAGTTANATVAVCHSRTSNLAMWTRAADLLIVATGKPAWINASMVKPGATVIDVGINRVDGKLVGDVEFDSVQAIAGHITPVPGGVGRLTVAMLLRNTLQAAAEQTSG